MSLGLLRQAKESLGNVCAMLGLPLVHCTTLSYIKEQVQLQRCAVFLGDAVTYTCNVIEVLEETSPKGWLTCALVTSAAPSDWPFPGPLGDAILMPDILPTGAAAAAILGQPQEERHPRGGVCSLHLVFYEFLYYRYSLLVLVTVVYWY